MLRKSLLGLLAAMAGLIMGVSAARADGLIVVHNPPVVVPGHFSFAPLEVTYHKVECDIKDQVAVTTVDQEFYNPNAAVLEGDYIFPVPKDANINKFTMDINGKTMEAELLPADKARKIYEDIVRQSKDPALLEYAGRAMFKVRIFPIEANSRKRIQLKYTELLRQDNNLLDYHYTLNTEKYSSKPIKNVSMKITINTTSPITTLYSPTHNVDTKRHSDTSAVVGFEAKNVRPDTDFHLYIGRKAAPVGMSVLTYKPEGDKDGYFVLLAAPTLSKEVKAMPKDVVFVIDTSGSMSADHKIDQAKKALKFCVNTLNAEDRFDIVRFSTEAEPFFKSLAQVTEDNKKKVLDFIESMKASGGTAIDDALGAALGEVILPFNGPGPAHVRMIVFLTDGQPTVGEQNPDTLLANFKKASAGVPVRIFSFGIGNDVNTKLLDLAAEQTRGYSQYVLPNEDIEVAVSNFFAKVQDPVIAGVKVDLPDVTASKMYPKEMPDLFKGDQLVVFGTYGKAAKTAVVLEGMVNGKVEKFAQDVTFDDKTDATNEWIGKLWATRRVGYLLDEIRLHGESAEVKDEVVALARKWGIVTPYTAMLIIEDERRRGVPVAVRSLREMEVDRVAVHGSVVGSGSIGVAGKAADAVGDMALATAINGGAMKSVGNGQAFAEQAAQRDDRSKYDVTGNGGGARKAALAKDAEVQAQIAAAASPVAPGTPQATFSLGGNTFSGATTVTAGTLNLGNQQAANGWNYTAQNAEEAKKATGYRIVGNYAQQNRMVNNRTFYLNGNQWTDGRVQQDAQLKKVTIKFGSPEYFELLTKQPEAAQYLSLGNNVTFEVDGTVYDIVDETPAPAAK